MFVGTIKSVISELVMNPDISSKKSIIIQCSIQASGLLKHFSLFKKHFTLYLPGRPVQSSTISTFLGKHPVTLQLMPIEISAM